MWTVKNRGRYDRSKLRYPSDLTDDEWSPVEPLIPPAKSGGNRRHVNVREIMNGLMYILSTGCQWRALPMDLAPRSTLFDYMDLWSWDGPLDRVHHALYVAYREREGREASPTAAIIDSQSVNSAEKGGFHDAHGYDAGKKIKGKKRHILVDTLGLLLHAVVHGADIQDRDGAALVLDKKTRRLFPFIQRIFADAGYQGPRVAKAAAKSGDWKIEIVKRSDQAKGFVVLPKRWIVERTIAVADLPKTGNASSARRSHSSAWIPSASCCESYAIKHNDYGQTLSDFDIFQGEIVLVGRQLCGFRAERSNQPVVEKYAHDLGDGAELEKG